MFLGYAHGRILLVPLFIYVVHFPSKNPLSIHNTTQQRQWTLVSMSLLCCDQSKHFHKNGIRVKEGYSSPRVPAQSRRKELNGFWCLCCSTCCDLTRTIQTSPTDLTGHKPSTYVSQSVFNQKPRPVTSYILDPAECFILCVVYSCPKCSICYHLRRKQSVGSKGLLCVWVGIVAWEENLA